MANDDIRPFRNYRRRGYQPPDEPWWSVVPPHDRLREGRARRLTEMLQAVKRGPSVTRSQRIIERYQRCIAAWQHYMEYGQAPGE